MRADEMAAPVGDLIHKSVPFLAFWIMVAWAWDRVNRTSHRNEKYDPELQFVKSSMTDRKIICYNVAGFSGQGSTWLLCSRKE